MREGEREGQAATGDDWKNQNEEGRMTTAHIVGVRRVEGHCLMREGAGQRCAGAGGRSSSSIISWQLA